MKLRRWQLIAIALTLAVALSLSGLQLALTRDNNGTPRFVVTLGTVDAAGPIDYILTPTNCNLPIQAALNALPDTGGTLQFVSTGTFSFSATVSRPINNVSFVGPGTGLVFVNDNSTPLISAGTQIGWIFSNFATDAGSITYLSSTQYTLSNMFLGATYIAYLTTGSITAEQVNAPTGRTASYIIAASDASATIKAQADKVLTGTSDQTIINAALSTYTNVKLMGGQSSNIYISSPILLPDTNDFSLTGDKVWIRLANSANCTMIQKTTSTTLNTGGLIQGLNLDGNYTNNTTGTYGINTTGCNGITIRDIKIYGTKSYGIYGLTDGTHTTSGNVLNNVFVQLAQGYSYYLAGVAGWMFDTITSSTSTAGGMDLEGCYEMYGVNMSFDQDAGTSLNLSSVMRSHFTNVWTAPTAAYHSGVMFYDCTDTSVIGGSWYPVAGSNNTIGAYFYASTGQTCTNCTISNFSFDGSSVTGTRGISQDVDGTGAIVNCKVESCSFTSIGTIKYTGSGTNSVLFTDATGRTATYVIAAYNSSSVEKAQADYTMPSATADTGVVFNAAIAAGYKSITETEGTFSWSTTGVITPAVSGITFKGAGREVTINKLANNINAAILNVGNASGTETDWVTVCDMSFDCNGTNNNSSGIGIWARYGYFHTYQNLAFKDFKGNAILTEGLDASRKSAGHLFTNIRMDNATSTSTSYAINLSPYSSDNTFYNIVLEGVYSGILNDGSQSNKFLNCWVGTLLAGGAGSYPAKIAILNDSKNIDISHSQFDESPNAVSTEQVIWIQTLNSGTKEVNQIRITDNIFVPGGTGTSVQIINLSNNAAGTMSDIEIVGNTFDGQYMAGSSFGISAPNTGTFTGIRIKNNFLNNLAYPFYNVSDVPAGIVIQGNTGLTDFNTPTGRTATYVIAASDAPDLVKAQADIVVANNGLHTAIAAAIVLGYRNIKLSQGTFNDNTKELLPLNTGFSDAIWLDGSGNDSTAINHTGSSYGIEIANGSTGHRISNLRVTSNSGTSLSGIHYVGGAANTISYLDNVTIDAFAGNGVLIDGDGVDVFATNVYCRSNTGDGFHIEDASHTGGNQWVGCWAEFNGGYGWYVKNNEESLYTNIYSDTNGLAGIALISCTGVKGTNFQIQDNGTYGLFNNASSGTIANIECRRNKWQGIYLQAGSFTLSNPQVGGNCTNLTGSTYAFLGNILVRGLTDPGCSIIGLQGQAGIISGYDIYVDSNTPYPVNITGGNVLGGIFLDLSNQAVANIHNVGGYNPKGTLNGVFPNGFNELNDRFGPNGGNPSEGGGWVLVASTDYTINGVDMFITSTGGTGISITIKDNLGNTIQTGLATLTQQFFPVGYKINFGAFSGAPTVSIWSN